jgi:RNA polymerase sigma-70 factor, ECF subfamily
MTNAQVAEILDTTVSAVETLLVRAKQNLRKALGSSALGSSAPSSASDEDE